MIIRLFKPQNVSVSIGWIDLAAFAAMGLLWLGIFAMLYAIYEILRGKARGDTRWGEPGL